jgi:beta-N-acetylhexosaminidase
MLIVGIEGPELTAIERSWLMHPAIAGVILFARNIVDRAQSQALIEDIRGLREVPLLVCVDQEGGPVQRFREGFAALPPLSRLGELYDRDREQALALTREHAWLMASEMRAIGIDFSWAPVLDLARGNRAIGDRAFHADPQVCAELGAAYIEAMKAAGMRTTGKHFPGHGSVLEDTHFSQAIDRRPLSDLAAADLVPFHAAIEAGVDAMMMAHVTYPAVDEAPAGYSDHWIRHILRDSMGFDGIVVSDDIAMVAAEGAGAVGRRVQLHLDAGCDVVLVCKPELVEEAIDAVPWDHLESTADRLAALAGRGDLTWSSLLADPRHAQAMAALDALA